ncbi:RING-H2 finger protein ATL38 [Coffea arabica]|uniref:RING-H2 finger protein ATL38 n=1 Tax=Coffea arabica TaxID=13443 RepID=A0A6P6WB98_COFAR|nr:RING-H2 finger protein ATL8-like [Coffea arabica]
MMSSGTNLVMTVIGFAVSTMFIVFVCTRLICARIQLNASRRSFARAHRSDLSILERGLHGLEPVIFANFPTKKYGDNFFSSGENNQCTVCLADYHKEDTLRILPSCGHFFHAACIDIWLHQHSTCPVCRVSLRELTERKRFMQPLFSSAIRAQHTIQPANLNTHHSSNSHRLSSTPRESQRMQPSQDGCRHSERAGVEDRQSNPILNDDRQITKKSGNKEMESPSNA